jgi:sugar phosphate isomerase/epimerase
MKLGCNTVLFNKSDLDEALQHIAWAGFKGAELCHQEEWACHVELNTEQSYIDEVKSTATRHGLELFALQVHFPGQTDEEKKKSITKMLDVAAKLSVPIVTIRAFGKADDKEATKQEFKYILQLCKLAEEREVILAVKPHVGASVYNTATVLQMLDEVDSSSLGVTLDPLHLTRGGDDPSEAVLKIGKRIVHTHFHDCPPPQKTPETPEQQTPGRSNINWLKLLQNLKDVGYKRALDVHVIGACPYPLSRQMGIAAEAKGYLSRCLQDLK